MAAKLDLSRVLIIDDDASVLNQAREILSGVGVQEVISCEDGSQAVDLLQQGERFDLGIVDLRLPKVTGTTLVQVINQFPDESVRRMPLLLFVGRVSADEIRLLAELGYTHHLTKPFSQKELLAKVNAVMWEFRSDKGELHFASEFASALDTKDFEAAKALLLPRLKADPNSAKNMTYQARYFLAIDEVDKAEQILRAVILCNPDFLPALNLGAKLCMKKERHGEALLFLEKAQKVSPLNIGRMVSIGNLQLQLGEIERAEERFRTAIKLFPDSDAARVGLAQALVEQGRVEESRAEMQQLADPYEVVSMMNMKAIFLARNGKHSEAVEIYQAARRIIPDPKKEYLLVFNMAVAHFRSGDFQAAKDCAQEAHRMGGFEKASRFCSYVEKVEQKVIDEKKSLAASGGALREIQSLVGAVGLETGGKEFSENTADLAPETILPQEQSVSSVQAASGDGKNAPVEEKAQDDENAYWQKKKGRKVFKTFF